MVQVNVEVKMALGSAASHPFPVFELTTMVVVQDTRANCRSHAVRVVYICLHSPLYYHLYGSYYYTSLTVNVHFYPLASLYTISLMVWRGMPKGDPRRPRDYLGTSTAFSHGAIQRTSNY